MMIQKWVINVSMSALLLSGLTLSGCSSQQEVQIEEKTLPSPVPVTVQSMKEETFSNQHTFAGSILAEDTGSVIPQVSGTLTKLYVKKGDTVKKGQVIGEIDSSEKQLGVREAVAKLAEAKARLAQAETVRTTGDGHSSAELAAKSLENARESYDRVKKLVEAGALPASQLDATEAEWIRAQSSYRTTNVSDAKDTAGIIVSSAVVEEAQVALEKAKKALNDTKIKSSSDGTINSLAVSIGDIVSPQIPVAEIVSLDRLLVTVQVAEDYLSNLSQGNKVQVSIPSLGFITEGKVIFVGMTASQTRLYPVEIVLEKPSSTIRPGMRAEVTIATQKDQKGFVLPIESIVQADGKDYLFLVKEGRAQMQEVKIIDRNATSVLIGDELDFGDQIVVSGHSELQNNDLVTVIKK